jgi:hypothetical protein
LTVNVNWALTASQTYWLLQTIGAPMQDNGRFAFFGGFPVSDADISVTSGVFTNSPNSGAWGGFNDITTAGTAAVPEPSTFLLGGVVVTAATGLWVRRRRAARARA